MLHFFSIARLAIGRNEARLVLCVVCSKQHFALRVPIFQSPQPGEHGWSGPDPTNQYARHRQAASGTCPCPPRRPPNRLLSSLKEIPRYSHAPDKRKKGDSKLREAREKIKSIVGDLPSSIIATEKGKGRILFFFLLQEAIRRTNQPLPFYAYNE